jgi:hypothetical protein
MVVYLFLCTFHRIKKIINCPYFVNSPHIIREIKFRRMRWAGHPAHMGEMRNAYKILIRKSDGKRALKTYE